MSELDRGRKHNNSEEQIPKVSIMFVLHYILILHVWISLSFEERKGYKKSDVLY